jgi:hypothetical protein
MDDHLSNPLFGFPDVVRFSWGPAKKVIEKDAIALIFQADVDEDEMAIATKKRQQEHMSVFLGKQTAKKRSKRYPFFQTRQLQIVSLLE